MQLMGFGVSDGRIVQSSSFGPITRDRELISDFFLWRKNYDGVFTHLNSFISIKQSSGICTFRRPETVRKQDTVEA
jgi:hypothetical protein